jgi:hypothetical protein
MCLTISRVQRTFAYNWSGDQIVSPLVSAARHVPGSPRTSLDIDVREFLAIEHSAEVRNFYLRNIVEGRPYRERERFFVGRPGDFDFRMHCVIEAFGKFAYRPAKERGREEWLLPAETLANGGGDCEDLSFLLLALLEEAGISRTCLRLAFGQLVETRPNARPRRHDHAWVMYQLEGGAWMILDPVERVDQHLRRRGPVKPAPEVAAATYEYQPLFVLNRDHLWRVHGPKGEKDPRELEHYLGRRRFWAHYDPGFAAGVHSDLFDRVMKDLSWFERFTVKTASLALDTNVLSYDPRDHCDFAYLDESWRRIQQRLNTGKLNDLGRACHTAADFYAHTLYAHVVDPVAGELPLYNPARPVDPGARQDAVFDRARFSINNARPALTEAQTRAYWQGQVISGQWWRWYATYPNDLQTPPQLNARRCLPDHDLLAVDARSAKNNPAHLYPTQAVFNQQFALRQNAAERHVTALYRDWCRRHRS